MELLYVWIDDYKNISKQGFNFSAKYHFTYNHEKDTLAFEERPGLPENFWGKEVLNLTLLLGKNGAGKSSILEVLMKPFKHEKIIFIFRDVQNEYHVKYRGINEPKPIGFKANIIDLSTEASFTEDQTGGHGKFDDYDAIYYTPIFRPINTTIRYPNYVASDVKRGGPGNNNRFAQNLDISTTYLLNEILKKDFDNVKNDINKKNTSIKNAINDFLINSKPTETLGNKDFNNIIKVIFTKPFFTEKKIVSKNSPILVKPKKVEWNSDVREKFPDIYRKITINYITKYHTDQKIESFTDRCLAGIIYEILVSVAFFASDKINNINLLSHLTIPEIYRHLHAILKDTVLILNPPAEQTIDAIEKFAKKNQQYISTIGDKIAIYSDGENLLDSLPKNANRELSNIYRYEFSGLSSGELYLLTLFGRLYSQIDIVKYETILILIDEGETTLHPHWQKQYIKWITEYIPMMFLEKKIQFILTTNNPIIASDVPSSNIVFLDLDKTTSKTIVRDKPLETHNTFAANIHTLYRESFFMEDGVMGAFALEKINTCIDNLIKKEVLSETRKDEIKSIISMVGEPILREKLTQLYHQKVKLEYKNDLDEIIERLKKLEGKKDDTDQKQ